MVQRAKRSERNTAKATDAAERTDTPARGERLSARTTWIVLGIILLAGLGLRLAYLTELRETPDFAAPLADAGFHDYWARGLATGDWTPPPSDPDPRIPEVPYLRPPGYPYVLAAAYELTGASYVGARIGQFGLGLINCVLAFLLARSLFGRLVGLVAAGLCATSWALIYFEGELQAPVLIITLILWMLLLLRKWLLDPRMLTALGSGLLLGALALVRANALLFIPVGALWIWWAGRKSKLTHRRALTHAAVFVISAAAAIAPATIRNAVVADEFVLISTNGPVNLYIGNNETSDGINAHIPDLPELAGRTGWSWFSYPQVVAAIAEHEDLPPTFSAVASFFTDRAVRWITSNPGRFLTLSFKRAVLFWGPAEISNNKVLAYEKRSSAVLRWLPGFPFVLSLALLGVAALIFDVRRGARPNGGLCARGPQLGPSLLLIGLFILVYFASFVPFLAAARFRVPLIPLLLILGAAGAVGIIEFAMQRAWRPAVAGAVLWAGLLGLCSIPVYSYQPDPARWHTDRGMALLIRGRDEQALAEFERATAVNPAYGEAHFHLAATYARLGRYAKAIEHQRIIVANQPDSLIARDRLVMLLNVRGQRLFDRRDFRGAAAAYGESIELNEGQPGILTELGRALAQLGRTDDALARFDRAIGMAPDNAYAQYSKGVTLLSLGRDEEAIAPLARTVELMPENVDALVNLGAAQLTVLRNAEAERSLRRALELEPAHIVARLNLAGALANQERYDEAISELETVLRTDPGNTTARRMLEEIRRQR